MNNLSDEFFMNEALNQARLAANILEVPIGAVIVRNQEIISYGYNKKETFKNSLHHAEIIAINEACKKLGTWRLCDCELFVTLEPCPMCAGAIINSRISRVIFGTEDLKSGACGSVLNLFDLSFNHRPKVTRGILREQCSSILSDFFKNLRKR